MCLLSDVPVVVEIESSPKGYFADIFIPPASLFGAKRSNFQRKKETIKLLIFYKVVNFGE